MNNEQIEALATELLREIWHNKHTLFPNQEILPIQAMEPRIACQVLGVDYFDDHRLGTYGQKDH